MCKYLYLKEIQLPEMFNIVKTRDICRTSNKLMRRISDGPCDTEDADGLLNMQNSIIK